MGSVRLRDRAFVGLQYLLPQHLLSSVVYRLTRSRIRWLKDALIGAFMRGFKPDMSDAEVSDPHAYVSFNAFFTRALRSDARPVPAEADAIASPVDGTVSQAGELREDRLYQAKGHDYTLGELLAESTHSVEQFRGGRFATIYLAPFNYHRIHMPLDGQLSGAWHVPGSLFSVNQTTAALVPGLFARNERIICLFESIDGPFALVLVGALFVGSMRTLWHGEVTPRRAGGPNPLAANPHVPLLLRRGAEMARFNMGSTVILLLPPGPARWRPDFGAGQLVRVGERLGQLRPAPP
ncbi:MAG: archaetidylserine decarboxylase [Steroidobacteraceae bacterium]